MYGDDYMHNLKIENLCVSINNKSILNNFNLEIKSGEIHAIMGPNGTGKSTLAKVIMGDKNYIVNQGEISFDNENILSLETDERARLGLFLGMQNPLEIEGVTNAEFLRTALNNQDGPKIGLYPFIKQMEKTMQELKMPEEMMHRSINMGFSGGEKKRNEILQMKMLNPKIVILDEIDSGLDVDSLKIVGTNVTEYYKKSNCGILLVTHHQQLLNYIKPTYVHIMIDGKIVKTGDYKLALEIEEKGYDFIRKELKIDKKNEKKKNQVSFGSCIVKESLKNE